MSEASFPFAQTRSERPCVIASVAFGPTVARIIPPDRNVVAERFDTALGLHAALRLGFRVRLLGRHVGYYAMEGGSPCLGGPDGIRAGGLAPSVEGAVPLPGFLAGYALSL